MMARSRCSAWGQVMGFILAGLFLAGAAWAQGSPDELAREAEAALRQAQNLVFSGKRDEAVAALVQGHAKAETLRQVDAGDRRLAGIDSRIQKLKTDLERRMGRVIDLNTGTVADKPAAASGAPPPPTPRTAPAMASPPAVAGAPAAAAGAAKLPYHAEQELLGARRVFESINGSYSRFDYYRERGEPESILKALDAMDQSLREDVPEILASARRLAAEKGVQSHPDFDEYEARLAQERQRSAETRQAALQQASAAAAAGDEVATDVGALGAAYDRLRGMVFDQAGGHAIHYNDLEPAVALLAAIEQFERSERSQAQALLAGFAGRYGDTRDAIGDRVRSLGYSGTRSAGSDYEDFVRAIDNVARTRTAMGVDLVRRAQEDLDSLPRAHDFFRVERRDRARAFAELAARFDPDSADIRSFLAALPGHFDEDERAFKARIDGRKWPGSLSGKKAEEAAGLAFFREDSDWGARPKDKEPRVPVAVAITGDWTVQKRDVLNRPVMYGVSSLVAVDVPAEKAALNVLRVYSVTLRTAEGTDVKQAPPFREITVGDSYYIRPGAVK